MGPIGSHGDSREITTNMIAVSSNFERLQRPWYRPSDSNDVLEQRLFIYCKPLENSILNISCVFHKYTNIKRSTTKLPNLPGRVREHLQKMLWTINNMVTFRFHNFGSGSFYSDHFVSKTRGLRIQEMIFVRILDPSTLVLLLFFLCMSDVASKSVRIKSTSLILI